MMGYKKKNRKRSVISAPKIVSLPGFLSPGNSLHRESVRTWFRPTPYINDCQQLRLAHSSMCCSPCLAHNSIISSSLLINGACAVYTRKRTNDASE